ncbi:hypothetical protein [Bradyrhizobium liaoningense]|uniref:hypothetical protein n=1 Tax=Bradyrhizobium liaoningense TaxID=43992 RepID=UPI001BABFAB5|nr:hypothetical protein [Bradyrhizobium liaoningense]MBR0716554.1 hypothetical protein [Bradyrhizobium liaoningense]
MMGLRTTRSLATFDLVGGLPVILNGLAVGFLEVAGRHPSFPSAYRRRSADDDAAELCETARPIAGLVFPKLRGIACGASEGRLHRMKRIGLHEESRVLNRSGNLSLTFKRVTVEGAS